MAHFIRIGSKLVHRATITGVSHDINFWKHEHSLIIENTVRSNSEWLVGAEASIVAEPESLLYTHKTRVILSSDAERDKWFHVLKKIVQQNIISDHQQLFDE